MANPPGSSGDIAAHLIRDLGVDRKEDVAWIQAAVRCFPPPTRPFARYVIEAIARIAGDVSWAAELSPTPDFHPSLNRLIPKVRALPGTMPTVYANVSHKDLQKAFGGTFLLAGTLCNVDPDLVIPRGLEALRFVLITCRWRWAQSDNEHVTAIDSLAQAIRAGGHSIDQGLLYQIGRAETLERFIHAAAGLKDNAGTTLGSAWKHDFEPELRSTVRPIREPKPPGGPTVSIQPPGIRLPPAPPLDEVPDTNEDPLQDRVREPRAGGASPRPKSAPKPLPAELLDEVTPPVMPVPVPTVHGAEAQAVVRYQIQQAIWSTNYLLLVNHPAVLARADLADAIQGVIGLLKCPSTGLAHRYGACALLLMALTGRTPKTLTGAEVVENASQAHDPKHLELLLAEGALRLSPFWQVEKGAYDPSYFMPDDEENLHLEPVVGHFLLPLTPVVAELLRTNAACVRALSRTPYEQTEAWLRDAARQVCKERGIDFTVGQLRASFAAHLFEACRDVAAVQLICADTLGQPLAPLAYYAPKAASLAAIHWQFQSEMLGTDDPLPEYPLGEARVGAQLLVSRSSASAMTRAPTATLHRGVARLLQEGCARDVHSAMVNQLAGMLVAVVTHRPTEALLKLTLSDVWLDGKTGAALLRDKVIDAAHDPRLVALPETVCEQFSAYLEHLVGLAERVPALETKVRDVLAGKAPLLFGLSGADAPVELALEDWKRGMPSAWQILPMNWGRHWMRTHAVEQGVRPELVNIQMGHLEVAGYPFSGASPTEPWLFVDEIAPGWEKLVRNQGWSVVRGIPAAQPFEPMTFSPLHSWTKVISQHAARQQPRMEQWRAAMEAKQRCHRDAALKAVLADEELIKAGIVARLLAKHGPWTPHTLTREDFSRIRDRMYESAGDDLALAIAKANAVCTAAQVVNRRTGQRTDNPAPIFTFRRPLDNAFVPGMMEAVRQVHALRAHISTLGAAKGKSATHGMASACARAVLAMALFGHCDEPDRIRGALERRAQLKRSASLEDAILVPWGDAPHQVAAFRGVAALVLARLARKFRGKPVPPWKDIERELATLLPAWALGKRSSSKRADGRLIARLCETVGVCNRYELSPAARKAMGRAGSTPAHILEQLALVDGAPAGTIKRTWETPTDSPGDVPSAAAEHEVRKGNARAQYRRLCAVFPTTERDTLLPLTGVTIPSGEAANGANAGKVVAEIEKQMGATSAERCLQPIVALLARWTVDMLVHGTAKRKSPALSTVETYLTRIGGELVYIFGQSSLRATDEAELEEAYLTTVGSKTGQRKNAAAAVLAFHAFAQAECGLPELDLSAVRLYLADDAEHLADARLVLSSERKAILDRLAVRATNSQPSQSLHEVRVARQAAHMMPLIAYGGMRRSEATGIEFRDVRVVGNDLWIRTRPNASRRVKTTHARRTVRIALSTTRVADLTLDEWAATDRRRFAIRRLETAYVFASNDAPFDARVRNEICDACVQACREVTGRLHPRLHAFRHGVAMERTTPVFLHNRDCKSLAAHMALAPVPTQQGAIALPRDLQAQVVELGHGDGSTTLLSYHHVLWLLHSRSDARDAARYVHRSVLAPLLGVTEHALDWAAKKRPGRPKGLAWLDVQIDPQQVPKPAAVTQEPDPPGAAEVAECNRLQGSWTACTIGALLSAVSRGKSLEKMVRSMGGADTDAQVIRTGFLQLEGKLGRRLLDEQVRTVGPERARRAVRALQASRVLEVLWGWYDNGDDALKQQITELADRVYEHMHPGQRDRIWLPGSAIPLVLRLLTRAGIPESHIIRQTLDTGLEAVRIHRVTRQAGQPEDRPRVERYLGLELKRVLLVVRFMAQYGR